MDDGYVHLMSVYNDIQAQNVSGILESEGIKALVEKSGRPKTVDLRGVKESGIDIFVPESFREDAMHILEVEMARGDF